jgi:hypothetical protein
MVNLNAGHKYHFLQVSLAEQIGELTVNTKQDIVPFEAVSSEVDYDGRSKRRWFGA